MTEQAISLSTAPDFAAIPEAMRDAKRWLLWRLESNQDATKKGRKVPWYANRTKRQGVLDSVTDQAKLATFDEALQRLQKGSYTGLGFALGPDGTGNHWQGIDLDDMPSRPALQLIAGDLPGYTEISPSGNGMHGIGYGKPFDTLGSNASGIEAYAAGRYFTVTGNGGRGDVGCIADFVGQRLRPIHGSKPNAPHVTTEIAPCEAVSPQTVEDLRSALLFMRADDRELWVRMGHALKTLGDVGRGLWMEWSATSEKFDAIDAVRVWESYKPTRTGYQAVFAEAQRRGWLNPASDAAWSGVSGVFGALHLANDSSPHTGQESAAGVDPDPVGRLEQNIVSMDTVTNHHDNELPHFVDRLIPLDEVTLLAGHGGVGKSLVALSVSVHVALGLPFGGLITTQTNVLFFSGEDGAKVLRQRLARLCSALKISPAQLEGKLHLLDASDIDPALHREQKVIIGGRQQIKTETSLLDSLAVLVTKLGVGLVVVDNASDTYDDDEIKRARVRAFVRSLRQRIARPGRAVMLLAHINKASANGGRSAGTEDYSGSTAWHNSVRSRLSLISEKDGSLKIEHAKANHGPKADPVKLEWFDGVPLVAGSYTSPDQAANSDIQKANERARDEADKSALSSIIQSFDRRGERVTTAAQGSATVYKLLKADPAFPKVMDAERLMRLLREMETDGRIFRRFVKTPDRKQREVFTCAVDSIAPIPPDRMAPKASTGDSGRG